MSYRLEVAFSLRHATGVLKLKDDLISVAENHGCEYSYSDIEFEGINRTIIRNHLVIVLYFPQNPRYVIGFMNYIKRHKVAYIESLGFDNCRFTLLYASKVYLKMMDKYKVKEYLQNKRNIRDADFKRVLLAV